MRPNFEQFLSRDKFAKYIEVEVIEAQDGNATARMPVQEHHLNSHNTIHGGAIFTLADAAFAAACNSHGIVAVAINVNISYLKAVSAGVLTAEAKEVSLNSTLGVYVIRVTSDSGELIAIFQGMAYRKKNQQVE